MKVRVAVIGVGYFGEYHARVYSESPLAELKAVVDVNENRAKEMGTKYHVKWYTDYNKMLEKEDIEAVSIATPDPYHKDPAVAAAKAGKHILLEKPMATSLEEADAIIDATGSADVKLMVDFSLRFDSRYAATKEAIDRGEIGEIENMWAKRSIRIDFARNYVGWTNPFLGTAVHDLYAMYWYKSSNVKRVYGEAESRIFKDFGVPDTVMTLLRFEDGAIGAYETTWILPVTSPAAVEGRMHIVGTKGAVYIDLLDQGLVIYGKNGHSAPDLSYWPIYNDRVGGDIREAVNHFLECILQDKKPLVTGEDGRIALQLALAVKESCEKGVPVVL